MKRLCGIFLAVAALTAPFAALGRAQDRQSLAEIAAEAKRKKQESTRPVLTNDNLRTAAPESGPTPVNVLGPQGAVAPSLAPFVPTPMPVVEAMLEFANVRKGDVVYDIGSGDGRIVIAAAELFGARAVGIEFEEELVERSRRYIAEKQLGDRVQIIHANALEVDLSPATVVTLYLTKAGNEALRPHLEATLQRGTRVVAHDFEVPGWTPAEERPVMGRTLFLYYIR